MTPIAPTRLRPMLYGLAAVLVLAPFTALQAAQDCVATTDQPVFSGGTNGVNAIFAVDLDDDGDVDILSASANDDKIAWYESDGGSPPAFLERVISTSADGAAAVHAADVDDDGDVDVLSASGNDDKIAWYENDGQSPPNFIERIVLTSADNASSVYAADFDDDGDLDILSASIDDDKIAVCVSDLAQKGEGDKSLPSFSEVIITTRADGASAVFAADVNGDGIDDVLSASRFDDEIAWYEHLGSVCQDLETACSVSEDCVECPDEQPDCEPEDLVPIGNGTCFTAFFVHTITESADGASSVFAIDLDTDGDVDVLSASSNDNEIAWYENETTVDEMDGTVVKLNKRIISTSAFGASSVFAIDLDTDGDVDVLSASRFDGKIAWYDSDGASPPEFTERIVTIDAGANTVSAALLDEGAEVDVLSAASVAGPVASGDKIAWHENDGQTQPEFSEHVVSTSAVAPTALLTADVDVDMDPDVLAASVSDNKIAWYENLGGNPPAFTEQIISLGTGEPTSLFWKDNEGDAANAPDSDIDGDGDNDLVVGFSGTGERIAWYENDGLSPPGFTEHVISTNVERPESVFAIDLDGDDDVDVLSASSDDDRIAWYENDGVNPPGFTQRVISVTADGARSVFAIDFDQDGDVDVLSASSEDDKIAWYESDGGMPPNFVENVVTNTANGARAVLAVDLDRDEDGDIDIVAASSGDDRVVWHENIGPMCDDGLTECSSDVDCDDVGGGPCVERFVRRTITATADFVRTILAVDLDQDADENFDIDIVVASSGDDTVAWYEQTTTLDANENPVITWVEHIISTAASETRAVGAADLNGDGPLDVLSGFFFEITWHEGDTEEVCSEFDASGDGRIDGVEVIWLGQAFADACVDPDNPEAEWWHAIDANRDCYVDGEDLAILASPTVWGKSTEECSFTCQ